MAYEKGSEHFHAARISLNYILRKNAGHTRMKIPVITVYEIIISLSFRFAEGNAGMTKRATDSAIKCYNLKP
jgi:hypothetical protein